MSTFKKFGQKVLLSIALCLLMGILAPPKGQAQGPVIDLYTMDIGEHFTEKFGHAALCVRYPGRPSQDLCYNYGTTNFNDPAALGWGFVRGKSKFWVSVSSYQRMMDLYVYRDRTVWVQELLLSEDEAKAIAKKLHFDSQEENKYYVYHHFLDNCTTRIRDLLDEYTGKRLSKNSDTKIGKSYRDLAREGFASASGLLIASDYIIGRMGDQELTEYEGMFLPSLFREAVENRFGVKPVRVHERGGKEITRTPGLQRLYVFLFSLLWVIPIWWYARRGRFLKKMLLPAVSVLFVVGLLLWGHAILSPLAMARYNESLLLFFPGDLILLFSTPKRKIYAQIRLAIAMGATVAAGIGLLEQPLWAIASLPIFTLLVFAFFNPTKRQRLK